MVEICLLRVNLAVAQNDLTAAGEAVAAAERVPNLSPAQIRSIALAYETLARPDDSDRVWQLLEKSGNSLASATLRADLLRRRGLAAEAEDYIVSALDRLKPEDQEAARLELRRLQRTVGAPRQHAITCCPVSIQPTPMCERSASLPSCRPTLPTGRPSNERSSC